MNSTYHTIFKMKSVDIKPNIYIDFNRENNKLVGDHVRIQKYKNILVKSYVSNQFEDVSVFKKVKNTVPWTFFISDFNREKIAEKSYEKELQKQIKNSLELKK